VLVLLRQHLEESLVVTRATPALERTPADWSALAQDEGLGEIRSREFLAWLTSQLPTSDTP
jgi:hypothetical protein